MIPEDTVQWKKSLFASMEVIWLDQIYNNIEAIYNAKVLFFAFFFFTPHSNGSILFAKNEKINCKKSPYTHIPIHHPIHRFLWLLYLFMLLFSNGKFFSLSLSFGFSINLQESGLRIRNIFQLFSM